MSAACPGERHGRGRGQNRAVPILSAQLLTLGPEAHVGGEALLAHAHLHASVFPFLRNAAPSVAAGPRGALLAGLTWMSKFAPASISIWTMASSPAAQAYISGVRPYGNRRPTLNHLGTDAAAYSTGLCPGNHSWSAGLSCSPRAVRRRGSTSCPFPALWTHTP